MTLLSTLLLLLTAQSATPVTLYEDCHYQGWAVPLEMFSYSGIELNALGTDYVKKNVSSIKVASGYQVTLYSRGKFNGKKLTLTGNEECLVAGGFNDRMMSIKIEPLP
ncbi:MAG: hypothetical protein V3V30_04785 [Parvularculaceae bacterium]